MEPFPSSRSGSPFSNPLDPIRPFLEINLNSKRSLHGLLNSIVEMAPLLSTLDKLSIVRNSLDVINFDQPLLRIVSRNSHQVRLYVSPNLSMDMVVLQNGLCMITDTAHSDLEDEIFLQTLPFPSAIPNSLESSFFSDQGFKTPLEPIPDLPGLITQISLLSSQMKEIGLPKAAKSQEETGIQKETVFQKKTGIQKGTVAELETRSHKEIGIHKETGFQEKSEKSLNSSYNKVFFWSLPHGVIVHKKMIERTILTFENFLYCKCLLSWSVNYVDMQFRKSDVSLKFSLIFMKTTFILSTNQGLTSNRVLLQLFYIFLAKFYSHIYH